MMDTLVIGLACLAGGGIAVAIIGVKEWRHAAARIKLLEPAAHHWWDLTTALAVQRVGNEWRCDRCGGEVLVSTKFICRDPECQSRAEAWKAAQREAADLEAERPAGGWRGEA